MLIAYFAHELADAAVQKRMRMLRAGGNRVVMLGFERRPGPPVIGTPIFVLGRTASGKFAHRILSILAALPRAWSQRKHWAKAEIILARNLETLSIVCLLAPIVGARGRIIYECLDIHRLMLREDRVGKILRGVERHCLKRVSAVLTSSPAFVTNYFEPMQNYSQPVMLVENKVFAPETPPPSPWMRPAESPWKIAWCGILRCGKSFEILSALAAKSEGRVIVDLWAAPALDQIPDFHARVAATPHMEFHGAYKPEDLPLIYREAHFVWAIDYFEAGGNSDWLLPNRLYEGLYHHSIPLAVAGVETARWLESNNVGVVLAEPLAETLDAFLSDEADARYRALHENAVALDPHRVMFTRAECRALVAAP